MSEELLHKESLDELEESAIFIGEEFIVTSDRLYLLRLDQVELLNIVNFEDNKKYRYYNQDLDAVKHYQLQEISISTSDFDDEIYQLQSGDIIRKMNKIIYFEINSNESVFFIEIVETKNKSNIENMKGFIYTKNISPRESSKCLRILYIIWDYLTSYSMLISLFFDILLMIEIYSNNDYRFLIFSIIFTLFPLCLVSFIIMIISNIKIPIINIAIYLSLSTKNGNNNAAASISLFLSLFMTFPLYVINLSYLLSNIVNYNQISIYNILQLSFSLFTMCLAPYFNLLEFVSDLYLNNGLILSFSDKLSIYSSICGISFPLMALEVIHFFPLLFSYYIDQSISLKQMWILLLIFNVPKLIFVLHQIHNLFPENGINHFWDRFGKLLILFSFLVLPLILYSIIWLFRDKNKKLKININQFFDKGYCSQSTIYFWNIIIYIWITYGLTSFYIAWNQHFAFMSSTTNGISIPVTVSIISIVILSLFITFTLPYFYYRVKLYI